MQLLSYRGRTYVCKTGEQRHSEYLEERETKDYRQRVADKALQTKRMKQIMEQIMQEHFEESKIPICSDGEGRPCIYMCDGWQS